MSSIFSGLVLDHYSPYQSSKIIYMEEVALIARVLFVTLIGSFCIKSYELKAGSLCVTEICLSLNAFKDQGMVRPPICLLLVICLLKRQLYFLFFPLCEVPVKE